MRSATGSRRRPWSVSESLRVLRSNNDDRMFHSSCSIRLVYRRRDMLFGGVTKGAYLEVGRDEPDRTARMEHAVVVVRTKYAQALTDRPGTTSATRRSTHRS